jgi:drug/metabolite transporter (DMT)-like permease
LPFTFALLWASSYAAAKIGLADITPFAFVALRLAIAAMASGLLLLVRRTDWKVLAQSWPHLLVGGALVHGLALATTHAALISVGAAPTALVHAFHPILTAALGVLLLSERFAPGNGPASPSDSSAFSSACRSPPARARSCSWR